jgi:hypothetical protein
MQQARWRGKARKSDGTIAADCLTAAAAIRLRRQLMTLTSPIPGVPGTPVQDSDIRLVLDSLGHTGKRFDKCPKRAWHLWRALVFNRDRYACRYCGRETQVMLECERRGLRFELDHSCSRAQLGDACDDFDHRNIVTACRSCNVMKGQMDRGRFMTELRSLAQAVVENVESR